MASEQGFVARGERLVHRGYALDCVVGEFEAPDGARFERDLIRHVGAVGVVPIDGDEVVLVRQYRPAVDRELLELPAGLRDVADETPELTAARELQEEAGLAAGHLEHLITYLSAPGFTDERLDLYLATDLSPVASDAQGHEELSMEVVRLGLDEAVSRAQRGEIEDAKTLIGLLLAAERLSAS